MAMSLFLLWWVSRNLHCGLVLLLQRPVLVIDGIRNSTWPEKPSCRYSCINWSAYKLSSHSCSRNSAKLGEWPVDKRQLLLVPLVLQNWVFICLNTMLLSDSGAFRRVVERTWWGRHGASRTGQTEVWGGAAGERGQGTTWEGVGR